MQMVIGIVAGALQAVSAIQGHREAKAARKRLEAANRKRDKFSTEQFTVQRDRLDKAQRDIAGRAQPYIKMGEGVTRMLDQGFASGSYEALGGDAIEDIIYRNIDKSYRKDYEARYRGGMRALNHNLASSGMSATGLGRRASIRYGQDYAGRQEDIAHQKGLQIGGLAVQGENARRQGLYNQRMGGAQLGYSAQAQLGNTQQGLAQQQQGNIQSRMQGLGSNVQTQQQIGDMRVAGEQLLWNGLTNAAGTLYGVKQDQAGLDRQQRLDTAYIDYLGTGGDIPAGGGIPNSTLDLGNLNPKPSPYAPNYSPGVALDNRIGRH